MASTKDFGCSNSIRRVFYTLPCCISSPNSSHCYLSFALPRRSTTSSPLSSEHCLTRLWPRNGTVRASFNGYAENNLSQHPARDSKNASHSQLLYIDKMYSPKLSEAERLYDSVSLLSLLSPSCDGAGNTFGNSLSISEMNRTSSIVTSSSPPGVIPPSTTPTSTSSSVALIPLILPLLLSISLLPQSLLLCLYLLRRLLNLHSGLRQILGEPRVRALLALPSVRTKASKVESAQRLPHMLLAATLTQGAESLLVMRTRRQSRGWIDV